MAEEMRVAGSWRRERMGRCRPDAMSRLVPVGLRAYIKLS